MSKLCNDCGNLITGNNGAYYLCSGFRLKRFVSKRKEVGRSFFNLVRSTPFRWCSRELKMDKDMRPLKCTKCLQAEARMRELEEVYYV